MPDWIAVADERPEPFEDVFVWPRPTHWILTAELTEGATWVYYDGAGRMIMKPPTHWRKMFKPPEEK